MSEAPESIGRYRILGELGRGMMGVVYRAHDPVLDRTVALKAIRLSFDVGEAERRLFEERFFAEARSAARLSHPGIVVVHDVGRDPATGTLFMALEHLQGRPLSALISEGAPLDWRESLSIVGRVAEALHAAHSAGVVHRDVKPANIMVLDDGSPKIMDFGVAKIQASHAPLTSTGQMFGTPLYMSPEQALGRPVDARSDLFSLGAVAWELLTGRRAFAGGSIPVILSRIAVEMPAPPSLLNPTVPPGADEIVSRLLAKEPVDRYRDGHRVAEDVDDVLRGRLPRLRRGNAPEPEPLEQLLDPAVGPAESLALEADLEAAFSTLAEPAEAKPTGSPRGSPAGRQRPRPGRRVGGRGWLLGAGALLAAVAIGLAAWLPRGVVAPEPGVHPPAAPPAVPPESTFTAAERLAQAVAARDRSDFEESRRILLELRETAPQFPGTAELLEEVEDALWRRDSLPLAFLAEHNHRIGSCRGQLVIAEAGIGYASRDHGRMSWSWAEIRRLERDGSRRLEVTTEETEVLRLGGPKRYDFRLLDGAIAPEEWRRLLRLARPR
jgi:serine/threonine protein kinase